MADPNQAPRVDVARAPRGRGKPGERSFLRSAIDLLSGADDAARAERPEIPGVVSFMRRNWKSGSTDEGFFRRYRRLNRDYRQAKERAAGNLRTYETIASAAAFSKEFSALLFASCIIATTGLFQGSTGVIIGAMLIAPLMMPILGFALAVVWGDRRLLWRSVGTLLVGSALVLAISSTLASVVPGIELNSEIRGRINPNLYDILVAVASGLIGAYAYANPRISPSIAGVSIAVALMPPLCTVGIGLGLGDSKVAVGALLLYLSNLLGISLAASFVFWRLRIHPMTESVDDVGARARRNVVLTAILLIAVALPLAFFMGQTYATRKLDARVRAALQEAVRDGELMSLSVQRFGSGYEVRSVVIVPPGTDQAALDAARRRVESLVPDDSQIRLYFLRTDPHELVASAPGGAAAVGGAAVVPAVLSPAAQEASGKAVAEPRPASAPAKKTRTRRTRRR